jgi:hypothetical protein
LQSSHPIRSNCPSAFLFVKSGLPEKVYRANAAAQFRPETTFVSIVAFRCRSRSGEMPDVTATPGLIASTWAASPRSPKQWGAGGSDCNFNRQRYWALRYGSNMPA